MKKTPLLVLTTLGLAACAAPGATIENELVDQMQSDLTVTAPSPIGDVTVVVPPETAPVIGAIADWRPIPGLSGAIQSGRAGNLAITVSAEIFGTAGVWIRARIDGNVTSVAPMFVTTNQPHDDVRSFTFVASNVPAGQHTVEIEWMTALKGVAPMMRDRSLTMHSAAATSGNGRLAVNQADSSFIVPPSLYGTVPGTNTSLTTAQAGPLAITFSSDAMVYSGRLFAQAVVDGVVVSDVLVAETDGLSRRGSRSFTFVTTPVAAGAHDVQIRARAEGGQATIYSASAAVASAPASSADGGMVATGLQVAPTVISSTAYVNVISTSFSTSASASTVVIDAGAESLVYGGRLFLRAMVDGAPARPGNVTFLQNDPVFHAQSFSFAVDNLLPGRHTVEIQAAVDGGKTTANIADRFVRVHHARRSGAAFAQPYGGMRPKEQTVKTLVICFDPLRPAHPRPTREQIVNQFEGTDGGQSARGWWTENSNERITLGNVQYLGCDNSGWYTPPPGREGNWYWDNSAYDLMWQDALKAADPSFDFHAYDTDQNGKLGPDELLVAIVRPQNVPYGTTRGTNVALDGVSTPLGVHLSDLYLSPHDGYRQTGVGIISHEFSHSIIGAQDLYSPCPPETDAGSFSIMSWHGSATHLDPWHKLKSGLVTPDAISIPSWTTSTLSLPAVETGAREVTVLYDPTKADREYFVVENRFGGSGMTSNYDAPLGNSVVLWHVIEDEATRNAFPFPAPNPICRIPVRFLEALRNNGASRDLVWADGTPAKIRVTLQSAPNATTNVEFVKLP
jgi:M6 family metalloprotease-like protein